MDLEYTDHLHEIEKGYIEILCVTDSMLNNFKKMIRPQEK